MKLTVEQRKQDKKSDVKAIRRAGNIPAVIYAPGKTGKELTVNGAEFGAVLRNMKPGHLATTTFTLSDGTKAIIKEVQYNPTSYKVNHIDFEELNAQTPVVVKVPVVCTGVGECAGIKLGGFLREVMRFVEVECLPKAIPTAFSVDVRELAVGEVKRVGDIQLPNGVRALPSAQEVVVVIGKRA